ncbi:MAG: damage-inducible protein CinA [Bacteroidetes bacterium 4572_77]|nr:MAG: damage-inducible protein CinA [Bacteroidetes bacterium 4572_77]
MKVNIEIINIGDELLIGQVVNTNASWMGELMTKAGFSVQKMSSIADEAPAIQLALDQSVGNCDVVLISGGLGPTKDDITKKVLSEYFHSEMYFDENAYAHIQQLFASRGFAVTQVNKNQAFLPKKAQVIKNGNGTAYGMWFEEKNTVVISMPGVPFEMKAMLENEILPRLTEKYNIEKYADLTLMTTGLGESFLAEKIKLVEENLPSSIHLAYLPRPGIVRLRLSSRGEDKRLLQIQLQKESEKMIHILGKEVVYGFNEESIEEALGKILKERKLSMATAESCTGGMIAHKITSISGSSAYFQGSILSYSNEIKNKHLGVSDKDLEDFGAVSKEVVLQMAVGVKKAMNVDYAVATSGIAGPLGGSKDKPVGYTWIAVSGPKETKAQLFQFGEHRGRNIERASLAAINMLRLMVLEDS